MRRSTFMAGLGVAALTVGTLSALPAGAQSGTVAGYATGTGVHADVLQAGAGGPRVLNANVSQSEASIGETGQLVNGTQDIIQNKLAANATSHGEATALSVGLGENLPAPQGQITPNTLAVTAPPTTALKEDTLVPIPAAPLAYAGVSRNRAAAQDWNLGNICDSLGTALSYGQSTVAEAQVLSTSGASDNPMKDPLLSVNDPNTSPNQSGVDSASSEFLGQAGSQVGLVSENDQQVAPVTLFAGSSNQTTIRVAGIWRLQAFAGGVPGSAGIDFGPKDIAANAPIVDVIGADGKSMGSFSFDDLLGGADLDIPGDPLLHLHIQVTNPKPTLASDGTSAKVATDILSVQVLDPDTNTHVVDARVGHMEAFAQVPSGGLGCTIPVSKVADPSSITAPGTFKYVITIPNPFQCTLNVQEAVDTIKTFSGNPSWTVTNAGGGTVAGTDPETVTWTNLGTIAPGGSKQLVIDLSVPASSGAGVIQDIFNVTKATCTTGSGTGTEVVGKTVVITGLNTKVQGGVTVNGPTIGSAPQVLGQRLPRTGSGPLLPIVGTLAGLAAMGGWLLRRRLHTE